MNNPNLPVDDGEENENSNNQENDNVLVSVPPQGSQVLVTTDHQTNIGGYCGGRAYRPYHSHTQQGRKEAGGSTSTWIINTGNNINIKGHQTVGCIIVGNTSNGASLPVNFPQTGRFIINHGGNINVGGIQERGSIVFGNARR